MFSFDIFQKEIYSQGYYYFSMEKSLEIPKLNPGPGYYLQGREFCSDDFRTKFTHANEFK